MKTYLESNEISLLENAASNMRDELLIRVLFRLGCRVSEILSLEVEDTDFAQGTVKIQHLKARINLGCPKCGGRLGRTHSFCPRCGAKVTATIIKEQ
jgi:integrase/recombinase XerD